MRSKILFLVVVLILSNCCNCFRKHPIHDYVTFSMIKPHAISEGKVQAIIQDIKSKAKILEKKEIIITKEQFEKLYGIHKNKPFFKDLQNEILNKKVIVMIIKGKDIVERYMKFVGSTEESSTLRFKFGNKNNKTQNAIHRSDSKENALKEICIFFEDFCKSRKMK